MINNKLKQLLKIIRNVTLILLIVMIIINLCSWNKPNNKVTVFNSFGIAIVLSESMEPKLSKNDLIVIKKLKEYKIGDIVVYQKRKDLIVHRIIDIKDNEVITKGDANLKEDKAIQMTDIYGKVQFSIPYIGLIITFFKSSYGIASIVLFIIFLFIYSCKKELEIMSKK